MLTIRPHSVDIETYIDEYEATLTTELQGDPEDTQAINRSFPTVQPSAVPIYPETQREGSRGNTVRYMQSFANTAVDGVFGPKTEAAVRSVQEIKGLTVDGICGPKTWAALMGEPVYYLQNDPRWQYVPYTVTKNSRQTIGSSGCGPTAGASVVDTFLDQPGDPVVTPEEACGMAILWRYRSNNNGTQWGFFSRLAHEFELGFQQTSKLDTVTKALLEKNVMVVANMGPGYFTKNGHYVVLWAADPYSKMIYTLDPASTRRYRASYNTFLEQSKQYFIFEYRARA